MTPEDFAVVFRNAVLANYVLPCMIFSLCVFAGVVLALGMRRKRATTNILGIFFSVAGLYLGDRYTAVPLLIFGLMVAGGLLSGLKSVPVRAQRSSRSQVQRRSNAS